VRIIVWLKRLLKKVKAKAQVWDTSAVSNYFEDFREVVEKGEVKVFVPEGVSHELHAGKSYHCEAAYDYIISSERQGKIRVIPIENKAEVDYQVIELAKRLWAESYDVTLVTCDKEQATNAERRNVETLRLPVIVSRREAYNWCQKSEAVFEPVETKENTEKLGASEVVIPCIKRGNLYLIKASSAAVYTHKGKRKFGREGFIEVNQNDVCEIGGIKYEIFKMKEKNIVLRAYAK